MPAYVASLAEVINSDYDRFFKFIKLKIEGVINLYLNL